MEVTSRGKVYILDRNFDHLGPDDEFDAELIQFKGVENINLDFTKKVILPESVRFYATLKENLKRTDMPINSPASWPILSKKMLKVLTTIKAFPHKTFPVIMQDNTYYPANPNRIPEESHDYIAIQLLTYLDVIDFSQSEYEEHILDSSFITNIEKLVLREPVAGFPPLFRLKKFPFELFVSAEARQKLEKAEIQGVDFITIEEFF